MAIDNSLNKPVRKIKNYLHKVNKLKSLLIIGTNDHTNILIKLLKPELEKFKNIKYYELKRNDVFDYKEN